MATDENSREADDLERPAGDDIVGTVDEDDDDFDDDDLEDDEDEDENEEQGEV